MKNNRNPIGLCYNRTKRALTQFVISVVVSSIVGLFMFSCTNSLNAQPTPFQVFPQDSTSVTLSDTLPMSSLPEHDEIMADSIDPTKYFFVSDDDSPERQAYAKELISFVERLQHDETTFDADLSAK